MLPQFLHPADLNFDGLDDLLAASGLAFLELEHLLVVDELVEGFLLSFYDLLEFGDSLETALDSGVIVVERFSLEAGLNFLEMFFELFDSFFGLCGFNSLGTIDFLLYLGCDKGNGLVIVHQLHALLHLVLFLLLISLLEGLQHFFNSVESEVDIVSALVQSFEAVHDLEQVFHVFVDGFVTSINVFLGSL